MTLEEIKGYLKTNPSDYVLSNQNESTVSVNDLLSLIDSLNDKIEKLAKAKEPKAEPETTV